MVRAGQGRGWLTAVGSMAAALAAGLVLAVGSQAWACFPLPVVSLTPGASGPSGARITVSGVDFGTGNIEIRWNALDGAKLATATGPNFATEVTVPEAPAGLYTLVVLNRSIDDSVGTKGVAVYQVTSGTDDGPGNPPAGPQGGLTEDASPSGAALIGGGSALFALGAGAGAVAARRRRASASMRWGPERRTM